MQRSDSLNCFHWFLDNSGALRHEAQRNIIYQVLDNELKLAHIIGLPIYRSGSSLNSYYICSVRALLVKAGAFSASASRPHRCHTLPLSPACLLSAYLINSVYLLSLLHGRCPAQLLPLQRQRGLIAGKQERAGCITRTYYDDEMSYKAPNTLLKKSLRPIRGV